MDTKALIAILLVAGFVGSFSVNEYLISDDSENVFSGDTSSATNEQIEVGNEAPDFTLTDTTGNQFNLSDYEGEKVLVLEFMNTRCGTCKNFEKNSLKSYCNNSMPEDVEVISVTQTSNVDEDELSEITGRMTRLGSSRKKRKKQKKRKPKTNRKKHTKKRKIKKRKSTRKK